MKLRFKTFLLFSSIVCAILFIAVSVPLIREMVAPNPFFGIRLPDADQPEQMWYEINRYGGWALVVASIIMVIANLLLFFFGKSLSQKLYTGIFVGILLICVLAASAITTWYARGLG